MSDAEVNRYKLKVRGLEAEIERLLSLLTNSEMTVAEVMADNERLRTEIERLHVKVADWEKVYAQCDQSRDEIQDKMGAEIERLTAALRAIANADPEFVHSRLLMDAARAALDAVLSQSKKEK